jgi:hypothetical protein
MLRERGIQRPPGVRRASSASSRSSRHAPRAASAPGTLTASQIAANLRCSRVLASSARSAELISCCASRSRPARSSPSPPLRPPWARCPGSRGHSPAPRSISNRATTPRRALTSPRPTSTVSRMAGSDSTASCNSAIASLGTDTVNMRAFISLLLTILSSSLATTTRNPDRDTSAVAGPGEDQHPGPAIRIGTRPPTAARALPAAPPSLTRRTDTARPVKVNGLPAVLTATP